MVGISSQSSNTEKTAYDNAAMPPGDHTGTESLAILFVLDEDEQHILLHAATKFLPTIPLPSYEPDTTAPILNGGSQSGSRAKAISRDALPGEIAHKLLDLENLVFNEILEIRVYDNPLKRPDYVIFYQETGLPITPKPKYSWVPVKDIPHHAHAVETDSSKRADYLKKSADTVAPTDPEIAFWLDTYFQRKEELERISNLSKLSSSHNSRNGTPRPLSPASNHSNASLAAELVNDDSCGELFYSAQTAEPVNGNGWPSNLASSAPTDFSTDGSPNPVAYAGTKLSFLFTSLTWQNSRFETTFIQSKISSKTGRSPSSEIPAAQPGFFQSSLPRTDTVQVSFKQHAEERHAEILSVVPTSQAGPLMRCYLQAASPSLYLSLNNFVRFFSDKQLLINMPDSAGSGSKTETDRLRRLFWVFNSDFQNTKWMSFLDFALCLHVLNPKTNHTSLVAKLRSRAISTFYATTPTVLQFSPFQKQATTLNAATLRKIVKYSYEMALKATLSEDQVSKHVQDLFNVKLEKTGESTPPSIPYDDFAKVATNKSKFRQIVQLLRFSQDPLNWLPMLGNNKRQLNISELSFTSSIDQSDSKRVRFDNEIPMLSTHSSPPSRPFSETSTPRIKLPYRLAMHCLTCGADGRLAHDKTEFLHSMGRNIEKEIENIDLGLPSAGVDTAPIPFALASKMYKKSEKVKVFLNTKFQNEGMQSGQQVLTSGSTMNKPEQLKKMAERHLTDTTLPHFTSMMVYSRNNTPAYQLLDGLRYFERRHKPTQKQSFNWDNQVCMESFGNCAIQVCRAAKNIFLEEDRCLKVASPVWVMGDIHGKYENLYRYEQNLWKMGLTISTQKYLFLGDYVDRGIHGVEVVLALFAQKVIAKDKLFMIRGNHELRSIQKYFSFYKECTDTFGNEMGDRLWQEINKTFDCLPVAAVVDDQIFCVHGGIPRPSLLSEDPNTNIADEINDKVETPVSDPENRCPLAWDLMWSDPMRDQDVVLLPAGEREKIDNDDTRQEEQLQQWELFNPPQGSQIQPWHKLDINFGPNKRRQTAAVFNQEALEHFLKRYGLTQVIRAHEVQQNGFRVCMGDKLLTVFSAANYCNSQNDSACILINDKTLRFVKMVDGTKGSSHG